MKPRLIRHSAICSERAWVCVSKDFDGSGLAGYGPTPAGAYAQWASLLAALHPHGFVAPPSGITW